MQEGEQAAQCPAEQNYVIFFVDGDCEGLLICVQVMQDAVEGRGRVSLEAAIKCEQRGKEREDECE